MVFADYNGLQLILRNLIDNALKNVPPTLGKIDISVSTDTSKNVMLSIQDNGCGLKEEKLHIINDIFKKPLSAQIGKNGLGLGIALISKFVQRNKGMITAQSIPNQGSLFVLFLPVG